jgi:phenylacetate-CoA ligase
MFEPAIESSPWHAQSREDEPLYGAQIAFLLERSRFYQEKLAGAGFRAVGDFGGL